MVGCLAGWLPGENFWPDQLFSGSDLSAILFARNDADGILHVPVLREVRNLFCPDSRSGGKSHSLQKSSGKLPMGVSYFWGTPFWRFLKGGRGLGDPHPSNFTAASLKMFVHEQGREAKTVVGWALSITQPASSTWSKLASVDSFPLEPANIKGPDQGSYIQPFIIPKEAHLYLRDLPEIISCMFGSFFSTAGTTACVLEREPKRRPKPCGGSQMLKEIPKSSRSGLFFPKCQ